MEWIQIDPKEFNLKPFRAIGAEWALVTAEHEGKANTMTVSWGGLGVLWGKNVATIYVRPQRYTHAFLEAADCFTVTFYGGAYKKELSYLGAVSGRDTDKIADVNFHLTHIDGAPTFEEARLTLICRKLYKDRFYPACFLDKSIPDSCYPLQDFHTVYIGEVEGIFEAKEG